MLPGARLRGTWSSTASALQNPTRDRFVAPTLAKNARMGQPSARNQSQRQRTGVSAPHKTNLASAPPRAIHQSTFYWVAVNIAQLLDALSRDSLTMPLTPQLDWQKQVPPVAAPRCAYPWHSTGCRGCRPVAEVFLACPGFQPLAYPLRSSQIAFLAVCPCLDPRLPRERDRQRRKCESWLSGFPNGDEYS
jgi:hypothetical protein